MSLSEYLSRKAREELSQLCFGVLYKQCQEVSNPMLNPVEIMAKTLEVHPSTIRRWMRGGVQSCNVNAQRLIEFGMANAPDSVRQLIQQDLEKHILAVKSFEQPHAQDSNDCPDFGQRINCKTPCGQVVECRGLARAFSKET